MSSEDGGVSVDGRGVEGSVKIFLQRDGVAEKNIIRGEGLVSITRGAGGVCGEERRGYS